MKKMVVQCEREYAKDGVRERHFAGRDLGRWDCSKAVIGMLAGSESSVGNLVRVTEERTRSCT